MTTTTGAPMTTPSTERALPTLAAVPTQRAPPQPVTKKAPKATTIRVEVKIIHFENYVNLTGCLVFLSCSKVFFLKNVIQILHIYGIPTKFPKSYKKFANAKTPIFGFQQQTRYTLNIRWVFSFCPVICEMK